MKLAAATSRPAVIVGLWSRLSLVARVMLSASLALIIAGAMLLLVSTGRDAEFERRQLEEHLTGEFELLLPALSEWAVIGDYANIQEVLRLRVKRSDIRRVAWTDPRGRVIEAHDKDETARAPGWFVRWSRVIAREESRPLLIGGRSYGAVAMEMTATPAHNRLWTSFLGHLAILALALGLDFLGILLILRTGLRPIAELARGARALEGGAMSTRLARRGSPELVDVISAFNGMAAALEAAQEALREEAERLSVTLSSIGDGVIATDGDGCVEFMNPVAETLTGWSAGDAKGRSVLEIFAIVNESTRQEVDCPVGRVLREGIVVGLANHTVLIARDGCERPIADSAAPIRGADGRVRGAVLVFRDQTEERLHLDHLAITSSVFEHSHNGILITDAAQRIVAANPGFTRITGYDRAEVIGQTPRVLSSGRQDAAFYSAMWAEINASGGWRGEIWNRRKNGEVFAEELSVVAVRDEHGKVIRYIGLFSDVTQIKAHEAQLHHMAHYDPLTGLPNRVLLGDRMKVALAQTERSGKHLAVCYLDLDGFKPINDTWGHAAGDQLLEQVATRLRDTLRGGDTAARLGGDEFVLLLANLADVEECSTVLTRVLHAISEPLTVGSTETSVTASIGVTLYPDDRSDPDTLLRHADQALYAAKDAGRNRHHLFDPRHDHAMRARRSFLERMEQALDGGELCLYYQPKINLQLGTVIGVEALIRWNHPERGILPPDEFLPQLNGTLLEIRIGEWVIETALAQMAEWRRAGVDVAVSVNIAPPHLARTDFATRLEQQLARHPGMPDNRLELEVLESVAFDDIENVSKLIGACQRIGVTVSLDDFGTGYSSLTYLKRLPIDMIKIDQSFIRDMLRNTEENAIVEGVIGLADAFRIRVIAEGVETAQQGQALHAMGCPLVQGYGIARPMPGGELPEWIRTWVPDPAWHGAANA
ncbi:MAG: EAL domain-containing protein [Rhodocyclales bacterium]|nr:EAL domain-containing protein [Rhodocyclales bacterium]